jgi:adenylate cyclase
MADLIAQGPQPHQRWRRPLAVGETFLIGREAGPGTVAWDERISRRHAEAVLRDGRLEVRKILTAKNPLFFAGSEQNEFSIGPGEHFVIGETMFTFREDRVRVDQRVPEPLQEQTFSPQLLRQIQYRHADQRLEVLSRLPEVIRGAVGDDELFVRLVNMLLAGISRAGVVAVTAVDHDAAGTEFVKVLHWDRRLHQGGDFQPSRQLILAAVRKRQSVLHVWKTGAGGSAAGYTLTEEADWAFCTPLNDDACPGWALYVAGRYHGVSGQQTTPTDPTDLREDVKFGELVASILASLRQSEQLRKRQASLSRFFAPAVSAAMHGADPEEVLAPRVADVCVLFCDLRGFTHAAERSADDLPGLLERVSRALGVATHHILDQGGVLGDFHGDAVMGFWGWPLAQADAPARACKAALAVQRAFQAASQHPDDPLADFRVGIGIAAGRAVAGRIGTADQVKVTVFGPVVNLASRLEGMTKLLHAPILLDEATAEFVRQNTSTDVMRVRRAAQVRPYGAEAALVVSELLPSVAESPQLTDEQIRNYEEALEQFIAGRWSDALELLHLVPAKDRVKDFLTVFIAQNGRTPPRNWDGVVELQSK